jgi:uncharacterized membrane protein
MRSSASHSNPTCHGRARPFHAGVKEAAPARADFRLCNNTTTRVSVALAYTDAKTWISEGWWNLKPGACETLLRGPLAAQFYYVYAMDERGGEWKDKAFMCTRDREFRIDGREDCFARGFDRTGFFEVDTGKDAKNWTVQLTDPAAPRAVAQRFRRDRGRPT